MTSDLTILHREVTVIARYVAELRSAIDRLRAPEITAERLPAMRQDLAQVQSTTRSAADMILDTAEEVLSASTAGAADAAFVEQKMMTLMEACSFQDLTGQRLSRVSSLLETVEERLNQFVAHSRAGEAEVDAQDPTVALEQRNAARLVNGPGGPGSLGQDDIDRLLERG